MIVQTLAAAFVAAIILGQVSPQPQPSSQPELTPKQIYNRAQDAWHAQRLPALVAFDFESHFSRKGRDYPGLQRAMFRSTDRACIQRELPTTKDKKPDATPEDGCMPPDFAFGFIVQKHTKNATKIIGVDDATPAPAASGPPVIGGVVARVQNYVPESATLETVDGRPFYHLVLRVVGNRRENFIHDAWIDPQTFEVERLALIPAFDYASVHIDHNPITVWYGHAGDARVISRIDGPVSAHVALVWRFSGRVRVLTHDWKYPVAAADWAFDPKTYKQHASDDFERP